MKKGLFDDDEVVVETSDGKLLERKVSFNELQQEINGEYYLDKTRTSEYYGASLDALRRQTHGYQENNNVRLPDGTYIKKQSIVDYQRRFSEDFKKPMNLNSQAALDKIEQIKAINDGNYQNQQYVGEVDESGVPITYNNFKKDAIDDRNYSYEEIQQRSESQFGPIRANNNDVVKDADDYLESLYEGRDTTGDLGLEMDSEEEMEENVEEQSENVIDIILQTESEILEKDNKEKNNMPTLNEFLEESPDEKKAVEVNNVVDSISLEEAIEKQEPIIEEFSDSFEFDKKMEINEGIYGILEDDIPEELLQDGESEYVEYLSYEIRDYHMYEPNLKIQKLFKSIIAFMPSENIEKLHFQWLNNENESILVESSLIDEKDDAIIGELSCPICGTKFEGKDYKLSDLFSPSPDDSRLLQEFLFKSSVENQKKGIRDRRFTYIDCDVCLDQIRKDFDKYGLPMQNKKLDNLYSVFGNMVGLSIYRKFDNQHNIKHLFPTQRIFLSNNKSKQLYYYNLFELTAIINFYWNNYKKSIEKKYSEEDLKNTYENLMNTSFNNSIKSDFLGENGFLQKWFNETTCNQKWIHNDLLNRFNIKLAEDFKVSKKLTCNVGVENFDQYDLILDKESFQGIKSIISIVPQITRDPNKCELFKRKIKENLNNDEKILNKKEVKFVREKNMADNIMEGEMDLSELEDKTKEEQKIEKTSEIKKDSEPISNKNADKLKEPTIVETIEKPKTEDLHWSKLSNIEFIRRYRPTQEEVKFYVGKLKNDKLNDNLNGEDLVNKAIIAWIEEKKKQLQFAEENSETVKKNLTNGLNTKTNANVKYKEKINKDYIDNTAFNRYKPEDTEDSKMIRDKMKKNAERMKIGPHPELLFADNDKWDKNPFDDNKSLLMDFHKTHMSKVLQIMKQDVEKHKANGRVVDFAKTSYIPTIDFDTGIRVMYVDLEDTSLNPGNANVADISLHTGFSYSDFKDNFQTIFVYSPEARRKPYQVANALIKLINYRSYPKYRRVDLSKNFVLAYTDEKNEIDKFEYKHSVASWGNAKTDQLAVLALINPDKLKSIKYEKLKIADEIRNIYNGNLDGSYSNLRNHKLEMVCSIRYIAQEFRDKETGIVYWQYRITQYDEHSTCMLEDGFTCACSALIREHYLKRGPVPYKILFEFDRTLMITPMLRRKTEDLLNGPFEISSESKNCQFNSTREAFMILDPLMQGVTPEDEKFKCRIDSRLFLINERSFRSFFGNRIPYDKDVSTEQLRLKEMEKLGFNLYYEPYAPTLEIRGEVLNELEAHPAFQRINKINIAQLRNSNAYTSLELQTQLEFQAYLLEMNNSPQQEIDDNDSFSTLKKWASVGLGTLFGNNW